MDRLKRVRFRFGSEIATWYLPMAPEPGDFVAHGDQLWIAAFVSSAAGGVTVICWRNEGNRRNDLRAAG